MPPRSNRNDNANAAAAAAPQDPPPAGRTTRSSAQAVAGPSRPTRGRTTASRTVSDQESRGFAPLSSTQPGVPDLGIAAYTSIRLSIWFVCVIPSSRLADEYTIKGSTPNPATDDPRTPSHAHRVANELASRLAQNTAMASPGPRQRDRRPYTHTTDSSESEEFPVVQQAPRRLVRAPAAAAANALSLNVSGSDSDDSFDLSQPAVQPTPQPAPQPAHHDDSVRSIATQIVLQSPEKPAIAKSPFPREFAQDMDGDFRAMDSLTGTRFTEVFQNKFVHGTFYSHFNTWKAMSESDEGKVLLQKAIDSGTDAEGSWTRLLKRFGKTSAK
ncbi:hypothetical protein R3P38DRAFT_3193198 [Favolaschia claudopus]|uniref:Uncharacterized protein n=1 Tax=Favolaschia claudopus TaxID=2862362 RepID=A0AAW0BH38_9AGAR